MYSSLIRPVLLVALGASLAACAASTTTSGAAGEPQPAKERVRRNPDLITAEEIQGSNARDALEVVRRLRPRWLRSRGASSINLSEVLYVYQNGVRIGGIGALEDLPISSVKSMRYYDPASATTKWGTGHTLGAIEVSTM